MGSGTGFVLGGLLTGIGGGITIQAQQKREDALLALRRQQQQEDAKSAEERDVRAFDRESQLKVGLLSLANEYKKAEGETEQQYKERLLKIQSGLKKDEMKLGSQLDKDLAKFRNGLDTARDAASIRLKAEIDAGQVKEVKAAEDGSMVITYTNGRTEVRNDIKLRDTRASGEEDGGGSIQAAKDRAAGVKPAASAPVTPAAKTPPKTGAKAQAPADAEALERQLNASFPGRKPDGSPAKKGDWINGPGGKGRAQWDGKRWVVYAI